MIKILFLAANPLDTSPLQLDEESRAIDQSLRQASFRDVFKLEQHWAVRVGDIQELLLRHKPHIVHFSGHGSISSEIILKDDQGNAHPVQEDDLKQLFLLLKDNIKCVILNACYSKLQADAIAEVIDCVIGMSNAVSDQASIKFSASFYRAIGYGRSVKNAFELGRLQMGLENFREQDIPKLIAHNTDPEYITFIDRIESSSNNTQPSQRLFWIRLLLSSFGVIYWIWPLDLLPGLPIDDIIVLGLCIWGLIRVEPDLNLDTNVVDVITQIWNKSVWHKVGVVIVCLQLMLVVIGLIDDLLQLF